jgi:Sulfotransferase family
MTGALVGTCSGVVDFGEYAGFYFAHEIAKKEYRRIVSPIREAFLDALENFASAFVGEQADGLGARYFVDSTPWNLRIVDNLAQRFPKALFVLTVRHYSGLIQSLERSYLDGWLWAGKDTEERARLWSNFYSLVNGLPVDRTAVLGFDRLCRDPSSTIVDFTLQLKRLGLAAESLDLRVLGKSYASVLRPTVAACDTKGVSLVGRSSFDETHWSLDHERIAHAQTAATEQFLRERVGSHYICPEGWSQFSLVKS